MRAWALVLIAGCGRYGFSPDAGTPTGDATDAAQSGDGAVTANANVAFVTSTTLEPGALGGLAGADATCNQLASAAGLSGSYVAWLSSTTRDAVARLGSARGWLRVDGLPIADVALDLAVGPRYVLLLDEHGARQTTGATLTASDASGHLVAGTCADFTNAADTSTPTAGIADMTGTGFTANGTIACNTPAHLYCFGIDHMTPVAYAAAQGRLAFATQGMFSPGGGFAAADALCASEASAAGLPGTYLALLASKTTSAASRFDLGAAPWVRVDGARLAATTAAFMAGTLDTALSLTASGLQVSTGEVWTGYINIPDGTGIGDGTCNDWTGTSSGTYGGRGIATRASDAMWHGVVQAACSTSSGRLLCLQQ